MLLFIDDLLYDIDNWMQEGDSIILCLDLNEHTLQFDDVNKFQERGLINTHFYRHPNLPIPATCDKNTQNIPIDGIWISPNLDIERAGMKGFGTIEMLKTDHRFLWVDITNNSLFGYQTPKPERIQVQGLSLNDPECIRRFNAGVRKFRSRNNIPKQIFQLEDKARHGSFDETDKQLFCHLVKMGEDY